MKFAPYVVALNFIHWHLYIHPLILTFKANFGMWKDGAMHPHIHIHANLKFLISYPNLLPLSLKLHPLIFSSLWWLSPCTLPWKPLLCIIKFYSLTQQRTNTQSFSMKLRPQMRCKNLDSMPLLTFQSYRVCYAISKTIRHCGNGLPIENIRTPKD